MKSTVIKLENVYKSYPLEGGERVSVLEDISLDVYGGEFLTIMGQSGSGKSTLMNMLGTLDIPTTGKIFLDGNDLNLLTENHLAQLRGVTIGFIFQQFNLIPYLSAVKNVMLPMIFQGVDPDVRFNRAKSLLGRVGLGERIHHRPTQLSGGERQRVAIARALINEPKVILADEPTGNLDSKTSLEIINLLKELHIKEHKTIIMVTHNKALTKHADRTVFIEDGKIKKVNVK